MGFDPTPKRKTTAPERLSLAMRNGQAARIGWVILLAAGCGEGDGQSNGTFPVTSTLPTGVPTTDPSTSGSDETGGDSSQPGTSDGDSSSEAGAAGSEGGSSGPIADCTNGVQDGDESDVDCGGSCDPCPPAGACVDSTDCLSGNCQAGQCGTASSCLSIKQGRPEAESGTFTIYPDGSPTPIEVFCDMFREGGGWTLSFSANGVDFDVAHAVPTPMPGSVPDLFASSAARYQQYATHTEEMFVCTTGEGETPNYEVRTFQFQPRFWDQSLDNAEIFMTGTNGTPDSSATEFCAQLVWGGCNLDHYGYAVFNSAFGSANWGRWSGNTYYGPKGDTLDCFQNGDQTDNPDAWFWHFVR